MFNHVFARLNFHPKGLQLLCFGELHGECSATCRLGSTITTTNLILLERFIFLTFKILQISPLFPVEGKLYTNTLNFKHNDKCDNTDKSLIDLSQKLSLVLFYFISFQNYKYIFFRLFFFHFDCIYYTHKSGYVYNVSSMCSDLRKLHICVLLN